MAAIIPQKTKNAIHNVKMTIRYENGRIMTSKFNISTIIEMWGYFMVITYIWPYKQTAELGVA